MAIPGIVKGIFFQTVVVTGISLPLGFYFMEQGGGNAAIAATALLWPIEVAVHFDWLLENPLAHPLEKFLALSAFVQFVGIYIVMWMVHMTIRKRWGKNPRRQPRADFDDPRDQPDIDYNAEIPEEYKKLKD